MVEHPRNDSARVIGVAALVEAATFIFGFTLFATVLADYTSRDFGPAQSAAFLADHDWTFYVWHFVILIMFGLVLIPLALSMRDLLARRSPGLASVTLGLGLIWAGLVIAAGMIANIGIASVSDLLETDPAQAATVWAALDSVQNGLGGGNEIVGGLWTLLVSYAALRNAVFPQPLAVLGLVVGVAGVVTVVPGLEDAGAIFGLGLIVWFSWLGVVMLRKAPARDAGQGADQAEARAAGRSG